MKSVFIMLFAVAAMLSVYGCGSGGGSSGGTESGPAPPSNVIIIGAGVAGLAAARELERKGIEVMVIEARDRIGGRVWTDRSIPGLALDMGASWIHGINNNPITQIASDAALITRATDYNNIRIYDARGNPGSITAAAYNQFVENLYVELESLGETAERSSVQDAVNIVVDDGGQGSLSPVEVNYIVNTDFEHEFAAAATDLAVIAVEEGREFSGDDVVFPNGYSGVTEYLAQGIDIRLRKAVASIDYSTDITTITTIEGEEFTAGKVIITVPLGVLKKRTIEFIPELSVEKKEAIQALGMGVLNKVYLQFPSVFWDSDADLIGYIAESGKGQWAEWLNMTRYVDEPVLLGFNAGTYGTDIESRSDEEVVSAGMNVLRNIYGQDIPEPTAFKVSRWGSDPYAYGSYSYLRVGSVEAMRQTLAEPVARKLYFAGEATHQDYPATVHGAYLSGIREADRID